MAAEQVADTVKDAVNNVAEKVSQLTTSEPAPNLVLDEVTGEKVSKSEFKKRQKQREKDVKKAEKEATRQPPPQAKRKAGSAEEDEAKLNPNVSQKAAVDCTHKRTRAKYWSSSLTCHGSAILRDPLSRGQAHEGDEQPKPLPAQVPCYV